MSQSITRRMAACGVVAGLAVAATAFTASAANAAAPGPVLTYGSVILLLNQYGSGSYLDTNGNATTPGATYNVSTNQAPNSRGGNTSLWQIESASGKADGTSVVSGDLVYLVNKYGAGTYLDTNTYATASGAVYNVSATATKDRGPGTGQWHIFDETSTPTDGAVRLYDVLHLQNNYNTANGGFLDTNGNSAQGGGAKYSVSASYYTDRGSSTGEWMVLPG